MLFVYTLVLPLVATDLVAWSVAWWAGVAYTLWLGLVAATFWRVTHAPSGV